MSKLTKEYGHEWIVGTVVVGAVLVFMAVFLRDAAEVAFEKVGQAGVELYVKQIGFMGGFLWAMWAVVWFFVSLLPFRSITATVNEMGKFFFTSIIAVSLMLALSLLVFPDLSSLQTDIPPGLDPSTMERVLVVLFLSVPSFLIATHLSRFPQSVIDLLKRSRTELAYWDGIAEEN